MVSKAREDLPDPETPVTTVRLLCGISKSMFLRLWTRAPRTTMLSVDINGPPQPRRFHLAGPSGGLSEATESFYYKESGWICFEDVCTKRRGVGAYQRTRSILWTCSTFPGGTREPWTMTGLWKYLAACCWSSRKYFSSEFTSWRK